MPEVGMAFLLLAYALWNFFSVIASDAQESFDTYRYFGLVFDAQNPGFTTTFLFVTLGDHSQIVLFLTLTSVISWTLFAIAILRRLSFTWIRWPMVIIVLLFSMSTPIWSYNTVLLTESLTVSSLVLWFAAIVWMTQSTERNCWWPLTGLFLSAAFAIITRPQLLIVIVPTQAVLLIWVARRDSIRLPTLVSGFALIPFIAVGIYRIYQLSSIPLYQFRYALNNLVDKGSSFRPYALENMPNCEAIPAALNGPAPWNDIHALESTLINVCPETWVWFNSEAVRVPNWLSANPYASLLDFFGAMPRVTLALMSEGRAMPEWLSNLLLNPTEPWLWMLLYAVLGATFAALAHIRPRITILGIVGTAIIAFSAFIYLISMWASDGYDINRHIYPVLPLIAIAFLVFPSVIAKPVVKDVVTSSGHKPSSGVWTRHENHG